ncbi:hypothetical protein Ahy_B05g076330 [Arachis hypogaea]|uniref:Uncharacterized protein n=1 Tax=Arachis hypogaea TaxID=3818 RepID=A0A444Z318_ARAHY|nr:hypothetical protein Ahy_B05g076330 [Arachis hypogaea]
MTLPMTLPNFKHKKLLLMTTLQNRNNNRAKKLWRQINRKNKHTLIVVLRTRKAGGRGIFPEEGRARTSVECVMLLVLDNGKMMYLPCHGISPPASQPNPPSQMTVTQPSQSSQPTVSQLEILAETMIDAGVMAALKFAEATSTETSFTAAEVYKTPKKEKEITEELKEKCYHWMTHVKKTKDSTNKYDPIFILKHQVNFKAVRHHFKSLMPKQYVKRTFEKDIYRVPTDIVMFMLGTHGENYIDPKTNKAYRMDVDQYAQYRQFFDKRKLASHPFLFVSICNGGH